MVALAFVAKFVVGPLIAALVALRFGFGLYAWHAANVLEKPNFTVVAQLGQGVELRKYDVYTIAEATFKRPQKMQDATSQGFRKVAGFIFGKNKRARGAARAPVASVANGGGEKMAMTAPVRTVSTVDRKGDLSEVKVSFVMGADATRAGLPVPLDADVKLRTVKPHYLAAVSFSGAPPSEAKVAQKKALVLAQLAAGAPSAKPRNEADTMVYGYHDPFITPNLLRKNEVGVMVDL